MNYRIPYSRTRPLHSWVLAALLLTMLCMVPPATAAASGLSGPGAHLLLRHSQVGGSYASALPSAPSTENSALDALVYSNGFLRHSLRRSLLEPLPALRPETAPSPLLILTSFCLASAPVSSALLRCSARMHGPRAPPFPRF